MNPEAPVTKVTAICVLPPPSQTPWVSSCPGKGRPAWPQCRDDRRGLPAPAPFAHETTARAASVGTPGGEMAAATPLMT